MLCGYWDQFFSEVVRFEIAKFTPCTDAIVCLVRVVDVKLRLAASRTRVVRNFFHTLRSNKEGSSRSYPGDASETKSLESLVVGKLRAYLAGTSMGIRVGSGLGKAVS
jgi:hypothetical protein